MAKKYEVITALYAETLENVANGAVWQEFLTTAGRNFRLTFEEQVLLFAQRPDATAVLPISGRDGWNQRFGLWVNKGAKGIAMFDQEHTGRSRTVLAQERAARTVANRGNYEYAEFEETNDRDERSADHDELDLHHAGRLPAARPPADTGTGDSPWGIRIDAERLSEEAPQSAVHEPADKRDPKQTSDGSGADRTEARGTERNADGEGHGRDGTDERIRPDEMGGSDEQYQGSGRGERTAGTDLQLNEENAGGDTLPAFLDETFIFAVLENKGDDLKRSKHEIEQFFLVEPDTLKRAEFLKATYPDRYTEMIVDGKRIGYKAMDNGLLMWEGAYLSRTKESVFSWGLTAELTGQLIEQGTYLFNTTIKRPKPVTEQMSFLDSDFVLDEPDEEAQLTMIPKATLSQQVIDEALCLGFNDRHSKQIICAYFMKDKPLEDNAAFLKRSYGNNGAGSISMIVRIPFGMTGTVFVLQAVPLHRRKQLLH